MMKHWLIQSTNVRRPDEAALKIVNGLAGITSFTDFGTIPFTNEITNWTNFPDREFFVYGSTKIIKILSDQTIDPTEIFVGATAEQASVLLHKMKAGLFYDAGAFSMHTYIDKLGSVVLNSDAEAGTFKDVLPRQFTHDVFIKPSSDLKLFNGMVLPAGTTLEEALGRVICDSVQGLDEVVLFASPKVLLAEYRFFVVNGNVVTGSQYRKHNQLKTTRQIQHFVMQEANRLAKLYTPAKAFTMDIGITDDLEMKIIEYNCLNCSGFYDADVGAIAWALRKT